MILATAVGVLSAAVVSAGILLVPIRVADVTPFPGRQLSAAARQQRCVLSDNPMALIEMNVLSRDLRNGCTVHVDVTGYTYEGPVAHGSNGTKLSRRKDATWQKQVLAYLTSGDAVILARRNGTGLSRALEAGPGAVARPGQDRRVHALCAAGTLITLDVHDSGVFTPAEASELVAALLDAIARAQR